MYDGGDLETIAQGILSRQGFDPADPPAPLLLAYCLLGGAAVVRACHLPVPARWSPCRRILEIRPDFSPVAEAFAVAHELAERHLATMICSSALIESLADELAACLVVPAPALRRALAEHGRHLPDLALACGASQSMIALRLGEVTGSPLALVTRRVRVRGDAYGWPEEATLRRIAAGQIDAPLERFVLTDAHRRVALIA